LTMQTPSAVTRRRPPLTMQTPSVVRWTLRQRARIAATNASCCSAWLLSLTRRARAAAQRFARNCPDGCEEHLTRGSDEPAASGARAATVDAGNVVDPPSKSIVQTRLLCDARRRCDAQRRDAQRRIEQRSSHPADDTTSERSTERRLRSSGSPLSVLFKIPNL